MRRVLKQRQRSPRKRDRNVDPSTSETKPRHKTTRLSVTRLEFEDVSQIGIPFVALREEVESQKRKEFTDMHTFASHVIAQSRIEDLQREAARHRLARIARKRARTEGLRAATNGEAMRSLARGDPSGSTG